MSEDPNPRPARKALRANLRPVALSFCLLLTSIAATAEIRWLCWESPQDDSVRCLLDASAALAGAGLADVELNRLAASLPTNMPAFARELRLYPARFRDREVRIPLLGPAEEFARVKELTQAVMCGSREACSVSFSASYLTTKLLRLLDDDPALD